MSSTNKYFLVIIAAILVLPKPMEFQRNPDLPRQPQEFYEVDALGEDFVDFGALIGPKGSFSWHSDHPVEN